MDRRGPISLIVIAIVILIDDQMPAGGSTLVSGRSTNCGCFRGCILHGTHRTYDQQHYGASFLPVSFTKPSRIHRGSRPSIPCPSPFSFLPPFSNVPAARTTIDHDLDDRDHPNANDLSHFPFLFFLFFTSPCLLLPSFLPRHLGSSRFRIHGTACASAHVHDRDVVERKSELEKLHVVSTRQQLIPRLLENTRAGIARRIGQTMIPMISHR